MSDVPEIIRQIAEKVGTTAEAAWPLYVQYVWANGVAQIIGGSLMIIAAAVVAYLSVKNRKIFLHREYGFVEPTVIFPGIAVLVLCCAGFACIFSGLPEVLAPAGAAIHEVVGKVTR